jgi:pullulanase/glycogen debranching enzyme
MTTRHQRAGRAKPLGAAVTPAGVNFSVFSKGATGIELLLFDGPQDAAPSRVVLKSGAAADGVALVRPDWSDHSHSLALTAGTPH